MRRRPRRGRAEPDRRRRRARRAGDDDAGEDAGAGGRRPAPPRAPVRAARVRAVERRHRLRVGASGGRRRLRDHGVLVLRGHVGHEHDQHRRRAARDRRDREGRAGHRAGAGGAGRPGARAGVGLRRRRGADRVRERAVVRHRRSPRRSRSPTSARSRSMSRTAARSARSSTPPRSASRSCPTRRATWPISASGSVRSSPSSSRSPIRSSRSSRTCPSSSSSRRRGSAATRATRRSSRPGRLDRSPTGTATSARIAVLSARGQMGETYTAESVIDTRFVGPGRRHHAGRRPRRGRAGDQRPRLDHGLPPARRRPRRPARRGLQARRHVGRRRRGRLAQRGLTTADTASAPGAVTRTRVPLRRPSHAHAHGVRPGVIEHARDDALAHGDANGRGRGHRDPHPDAQAPHARLARPLLHPQAQAQPGDVGRLRLRVRRPVRLPRARQGHDALSAAVGHVDAVALRPRHPRPVRGQRRARGHERVGRLQRRARSGPSSPCRGAGRRASARLRSPPNRRRRPPGGCRRGRRRRRSPWPS